MSTGAYITKTTCRVAHWVLFPELLVFRHYLWHIHSLHVVAGTTPDPPLAQHRDHKHTGLCHNMQLTPLVLYKYTVVPTVLENRQGEMLIMKQW